MVLVVAAVATVVAEGIPTLLGRVMVLVVAEAVPTLLPIQRTSC
jgi:hypothetical protein